MKFVWIGSCALIGATLGATVAAEPAGTLLFSQPGTQILDATGTPRPALRGDVVQDGERLLTPPGAISQIKLPDGSLIGMRPDSELKMEMPTAVTDNAPHVVSLVRGAARIIGAELMDAKKISNFTFQSGPAVLKLQGADLESAVVPPGAKDGRPGPGDNAPGSYQRLLIGTGSVGNGKLLAPLEPRQVSFVGAANVPPVTLASAPPVLFISDSRLLASSVIGTPTTKETIGTQPLPILGTTPILLSPTGLPTTPLAPPPSPILTSGPVISAFTPLPKVLVPPPTVFVPPPAVFVPPIVTFRPCIPLIGRTTCI